MKSKTKANSTLTRELPPMINVSDTKYPPYKSKNPVVWDAANHGRLTFHHTERFGWCIATLPISGARAGSGYVARTYAIRLEPKWSGSTEHEIVSVGNGPHVSKTVEVYVRKNRVKTLQKYLDLYAKGMGDAGSIRDRISTRRANTSLRRSVTGFWAY